MTDIIKAGEKTWYMEGFAAAGFYAAGDGTCYLIDAGNTEQSGREIDEVLTEMGWNLSGILLTHAHTDHFGGCAYLQKKYGCPVFAKGSEAAIASNSFLEPAMFHGGYPYPQVMKRGIYYSDSCVCQDISSELFPQDIEVVDLPGHSCESVGYITPDGTAFIGDAVFDEETAERYPLQSIYSIDDELDSFEKLKEIKADRFVTGHGGMFKDIRPVCEKDRQTVLEVADLILGFTQQPRSTEEIVSCLIKHYNIREGHRTYALILSIARTYISWHCEKENIEAVFEDGFLRWRRKY